MEATLANGKTFNMDPMRRPNPLESLPTVPVSRSSLRLAALLLFPLNLVAIATWTGSCTRSRPSNSELPQAPATGGTTLPASSFTNPVINMDFPDPGVVVGPDGTFYAFATNGNGRNVQVERSADLVHWKQLPDALPTLPAWARRGRTWAPDAALMADGVHYNLYYTARARATGQQAVGVATSTTPAGPYAPVGTEPLVAQFILGGAIDPGVFAALDGVRYLLWKNDGNSMGLDTWIYIQRLAADGLSLIGEPTKLIRQDQPWEGSVVEAPNLIHRNGKYYLFYSANAFNTPAYAEGYAVSDSLLGPYTKPAGPLATSANGVIGPGGGRVVIGPDGNTWMLYHSWENNLTYRSMSLDRLDWNGDVPVLRGPSRIAHPAPSGGRDKSDDK